MTHSFPTRRYSDLCGIGKQKGFTEIVQKVQTEHDYAPQVGRQPERNPEPLVPVRYLNPEQRAETIIVEPAPIYVSSAEQNAEQTTSAPRDSWVSLDMPDDNEVQSYNTQTTSAT